ncbi:hypothetical protein MUG91_G18n149 [Manis pentadactyla]|nr:hypothetical protein MUG91_G18n149 [Manis pentadactyla]
MLLYMDDENPSGILPSCLSSFALLKHCLSGSKQHTHRCSDQGKASLNSVRPQEEVLNHELTFGCEDSYYNSSGF